MPYSYIPYKNGISVVDPEPAGIPASSINVNFRAVGDYIESVSGVKYGTIGCSIDAGSVVIGTGIKNYSYIPYDCTILSCSVVGNVSGSIEMDIKKCTSANFPTTSSIVGTSYPSIISGYLSLDTTLSGWTTTINTNDILEFYVRSCENINKTQLLLKVSK